MADTFNKKEREKKKQKKRKEKEAKREQRKSQGKQTEEFVYIDEFGNFTTTPPDPTQKSKIDVSEIEISIPKKEKEELSDSGRKGIVKFFNIEKGYGFIIEKNTQTSYFVHADNLIDDIRDRDHVVFTAGEGPKGPIALEVKRD